MSISPIWRRGEVLREVPVTKPVLASWDAKNAPSQIRLSDYLRDLIPSLGPFPAGSDPLFLHFQIGVNDPGKLLAGCDLENYLFPLFGIKWLPSSRFALVGATKRVRVPNLVTIGIACPEPLPSSDWQSATVQAGAGYDTKLWKERVRHNLAARNTPLSAGAVDVQIAFRCSPRRNWTNLWKPSGDCMGPILGANRSIGFNPCDDRIVDIQLHKVNDGSAGNDVELGYWWRAAAT